MQTTINNEVYTISWTHNNNVGIIGEKGKPIKSSTECIITITGGGVVTGRSVLHDSDKNYNRKEGKKKSFERAVKCFNDRGIRTQLWDAYWKSYWKPLILLEVSEEQLSMLNTIADVMGTGEDRIYTVNKNSFKVKLKQNDTSTSNS